MALAYDALPPQLEALAATSTSSPITARAGSRCSPGVKHRAVTTAKEVVDEAVLVAGGSSYFSWHELGAAVPRRARGLFHPSDPESAALHRRDRGSGSALLQD